LKVLINRFDGLLGFARAPCMKAVSSAANAYEFVFRWGVLVK
jgi:hypothetical protein